MSKPSAPSARRMTRSMAAWAWWFGSAPSSKPCWCRASAWWPRTRSRNAARCLVVSGCRWLQAVGGKFAIRALSHRSEELAWRNSGRSHVPARFTHALGTPGRTTVRHRARGGEALKAATLNHSMRFLCCPRGGRAHSQTQTTQWVRYAQPVPQLTRNHHAA